MLLNWLLPIKAKALLDPAVLMSASMPVSTMRSLRTVKSAMVSNFVARLSESLSKMNRSAPVPPVSVSAPAPPGQLVSPRIAVECIVSAAAQYRISAAAVAFKVEPNHLGLGQGLD